MDSREIFTIISQSPEHSPEAIGEAFASIFIPRGVRDLILDYLNNDIKPIMNGAKGKSLSEQYSEFKLFGRDLPYFVDVEPLAAAARAILHGKEEEIQNVLKLVKQNPMLLHISTKGCDSLNRCAEGSLLQIAAMAGDFNLKQKIHDEKEMGLVERLQLAANVSDEIVKNELEVVIGKDAMLENGKRNQLVLLAVDKLIDGILEVKVSKNEKFIDFQKRCLSLAVNFNGELAKITSQPIRAGYIFDPSVIGEAAKKLEKNIKSFGGWFSFQCGIFRVIGLGMMQRHLSVRDAEVVDNGMVNYLEKHKIPKRNLNLCYYLLMMGYEYYLNYEGQQDKAHKCQLKAPQDTREMQAFEKLALNKNISIQKFMKTESVKSSYRSYLPW